jgi:superoxide dismutase, Cu-Zn family
LGGAAIAAASLGCYAPGVREAAMRRWAVGTLMAGWLLCTAGLAGAAELRAEMREATAAGPGNVIGTVTISDSPAGAVVKTQLKGLPPGSHGFHVHENGSCQPSTATGQPVPAGAAGGHFDPQHSGKHEGPEGSGHLGDLPALQVGTDGAATQTLTAPHIKDVGALRGKAVMIHAGGDNYSDQPAPLGGGGARIACGLLE